MGLLYGTVVGTGYSGPTVCASGLTCVAVSPPYYYQVRVLFLFCGYRRHSTDRWLIIDHIVPVKIKTYFESLRVVFSFHGNRFEIATYISASCITFDCIPLNSIDLHMRDAFCFFVGL